MGTTLYNPHLFLELTEVGLSPCLLRLEVRPALDVGYRWFCLVTGFLFRKESILKKVTHLLQQLNVNLGEVHPLYFCLTCQSLAKGRACTDLPRLQGCL